METARVLVNADKTYQEAEARHIAYINAALEESMMEANDPNARRLTHSEVMESLNQRREARRRQCMN